MEEWYAVVLGVVVQMDQSAWLSSPQRVSRNQCIA
jgi:hypothetical protein